MRILFIAVGASGLNRHIEPGVHTALETASEVRALSKLHVLTELRGIVTKQNVYDACQGELYDVLHIAGHSDADHIELSNGESLIDEDLLRLIGMARFRLLFFNSCESGRLAQYAVNNGAPYAIATNREIPDADAWTAAYAFYDHCHAQEERTGKTVPVDFGSAYMAAFNGKGTYGFLSSPRRQAEIAGLLTEMHEWRQAQTEDNNAWRRSQRRTNSYLLAQAGAGWAILLGVLLLMIQHMFGG